MIDYREFMLQGQSDIERARELFTKEDYGFAAYSAQQGFEKYLKSYFMKLNIIKNPDIGHLPYSELLKIIVDEYNELIKYENDDIIIQYLQTSKDYFNSLKNILDSFQKSDPKKILLWKSSLKIELNDDEQKISNGIDIELGKLQSIMLNGLAQLFSNLQSQESETVDSDNVQGSKIMNPDDSQRLVEWMVHIIQNVQQNIETDFIKEVNNFEEIISPYLYGVKENSFSKQDTDFIMKFFKIWKTFSWLGLILLSYPHEEIGRYPTNINHENSLKLYKEKNNELLDLINILDSACLEIRTSILSMKF